jgi:type IV pilus assembly protein PilM
MKSKSFGLDIGSTSMKAVWLGRSGNNLTIESVVSAPTTTRGMLTESDMDQKMFADSVKGILKSAGITEKNANVSIPESQVYSKIIEMPDLSDSELAASLKFELEQHIPLPLDQVKTDWQVMERIDEAGKRKMNVLIVAAPLGILAKYEKVTGLIGITPQTVETEVISVHRALSPALDQTAADVIVHLGGSTTDVAIVKNGVLNMIFTIPLGGIAVTRAIAIDFGIDPNQAENFKRAYGLSQNVFEGKIGKSLEPILQSIIGDIRKAILSFKEKNNNMPVKQIILSGGSALLPGLHVFFANILGIQVVVGNCWEINGVADVPQEVMEDAPSYNVVFGLAMRDLL